MTSPHVTSAPPPEADDPAALEMADVVAAIFRMFDGHIDAMLGASAPAAFEDAAAPPVTLVGAPDAGGPFPHG